MTTHRVVLIPGVRRTVGAGRSRSSTKPTLGMVGGLGVVPGANIGDDGAIFEAVHGSAPDSAGQGIANPLALLMSGVMMLNHLTDTQGDVACGRVAQRIKDAYNRALADGKKTRDLGGELSTDAFAQAVIERLPA